jgi:hypothetical protein
MLHDAIFMIARFSPPPPPLARADRRAHCPERAPPMRCFSSVERPAAVHAERRATRRRLDVTPPPDAIFFARRDSLSRVTPRMDILFFFFT